jgi:hypothetical protein
MVQLSGHIPINPCRLASAAAHAITSHPNPSPSRATNRKPQPLTALPCPDRPHAAGADPDSDEKCRQITDKALDVSIKKPDKPIEAAAHIDQRNAAGHDPANLNENLSDTA